MIAVRAIEMRDHFKDYCDKVAAGETVIVARKNNKNVVVLSEAQYNSMLKAAKNALYLEMIDKSMEELQSGGFIPKTIHDLKGCE